jgi:hypothetical protein
MKLTSAGARLLRIFANMMFSSDYFWPHAMIHARTSYLKSDGSAGAGRYTDSWHWIDGRWQCVSAQNSAVKL